MKYRLLRHKFLLAIWLVVFGIGGYTSYLLFFKSSGGENPYALSNASQQQPTEPAKEEPKKGEKGQTLKDGDLEFTVTKVACNGETTIGENAYSRAEAQGQYCRLGITIKNTGQTAADLPLSMQRVHLGGESAYAASDATRYAQKDQTRGYWYEQIPAGMTVSGDLVFDVDAGDSQRLVGAELHATQNSTGVTFVL